MLGLHWDNGKENEDYHSIGFRVQGFEHPEPQFFIYPIYSNLSLFREVKIPQL